MSLDPPRRRARARAPAPRRAPAARTLARDWPMEYEWPPRGRTGHSDCGADCIIPHPQEQ